MTNQNSPLLSEIDQFLAEFPMGVSYFGKVSTGNSEVVQRLREGRRVWPETEQKMRDFMRRRRRDAKGAA